MTVLVKTAKGSKPRGIRAGRKMRTHRRTQKWADLSYKKVALGTAYKHSPFGGSSHAKGIVLEKIGVEVRTATIDCAVMPSHLLCAQISEGLNVKTDGLV